MMGIKYLYSRFDFNDEIIDRDEKENFISEICWRIKEFGVNPQSIFYKVLDYSSLKCAEALITGQTPLVVDVNLPLLHYGGMCPLHLVVSRRCEPSLVELLLCYGARTDIRYSTRNRLDSYDNMTPLQMALQQPWNDYNVRVKWTPRQSIYKLIVLLCLPRMQNRLEAISLLAGMTEKTDEIFLDYALQAKVIEFATLLMVAHKKLNNVLPKVRQCLDSIEKNNPSIRKDLKEKVAYMQQLIRVFEKAGDDISAYLKEDKFYVSKEQTVADVTWLLLEAGFQVCQPDDDLSCFKIDNSWQESRTEAPYEGHRCLDDFGMLHYAKSGYRWKVSKEDQWWKFLNEEAHINELKNKVEILKAANLDIRKQQKQANSQTCMDDDLGKALEEDDREEFVSVIKRNQDFFRSRKQQLMYVVCSSGSIKCVEALLDGDTHLTVELNQPCTNMGMYPLHCAALSLFPSVVELLLFRRAKSDVRFKPCHPSDIYPNYLLEQHANMLPLHMALWGISRLPCMREWIPDHSVAKLVTLLCLPRMQNPLETLRLLAGLIDYLKDYYTKLATDEKLIELAALLIVTLSHRKFEEYRSNTYLQLCDNFEKRPMVDEEQAQKQKSMLAILDLFKKDQDVVHDIEPYIKEDKHNVSKYQAIEDVTCILQNAGCVLEPSDTDLSIYDWYRDEEPLYPSEAPYEDVRLLHDVGMKHYSRTKTRWRASEKEMYTWRSAKTEECIKGIEYQIQRLTEVYNKGGKQLQKVHLSTPEVPYYICKGLPVATSDFFDAMKPKIKNKASQTLSNNYLKLSTRGVISTMKPTINKGFRLAMATSSRNLHITSFRSRTLTAASLFKRIIFHKSSYGS